MVFVVLVKLEQDLMLAFNIWYVYFSDIQATADSFVSRSSSRMDQTGSLSFAYQVVHVKPRKNGLSNSSRSFLPFLISWTPKTWTV